MATGKRKKSKKVAKPVVEVKEEDENEDTDQEEVETEEDEDTSEDPEVTPEEPPAEELVEKKRPALMAVAVEFPAHVPEKVVVKLNNNRKLILDREQFSELCLKLSNQD